MIRNKDQIADRLGESAPRPKVSRASLAGGSVVSERAVSSRRGAGSPLHCGQLGSWGGC
jgi:hypothetical protein